ncbi:hypothetical protein I5M27_02395 [Adhaeribacter sp. BT258]|uniref:Uncharacterized protein n=1 Tax=Adhaeribacter terrigena TaxID=2793070 RepID=A0ABS1BXF6_9BACT|nr:hypothetical protein [Adhaeribacter terrigena]MBK0401815.1 hypothetical protein [Adhaeribacter terrigena]
MILKDITLIKYKEIKATYGKDYIQYYNLALAEFNNLRDTFLYKKLLPIPDSDGQFYILALIDQGGNCIRAAWTSFSPLHYWINHLKEKDVLINKIKDIIILDTVSDKKEAIKKCKELKSSILKISRTYKTSNIE